MKSYQVQKLHNFHLATRENFSVILNVIILISRPISGKFYNVIGKNIAVSGIISFHQSRVNVDCLSGNSSLTPRIFSCISGTEIDVKCYLF